MPVIRDTHIYRNSVSVDIAIPKPEQIEWIELIAEQGDDIIFSKKLSNPHKFVELQIIKNLGGRTNLKLITKLREVDQLFESDVKKIKL